MVSSPGGEARVGRPAWQVHRGGLSGPQESSQMVARGKIALSSLGGVKTAQPWCCDKWMGFPSPRIVLGMHTGMLGHINSF